MAELHTLKAGESIEVGGEEVTVVACGLHSDAGAPLEPVVTLRVGHDGSPSPPSDESQGIDGDTEDQPLPDEQDAEVEPTEGATDVTADESDESAADEPEEETAPEVEPEEYPPADLVDEADEAEDSPPEDEAEESAPADEDPEGAEELGDTDLDSVDPETVDEAIEELTDAIDEPKKSRRR